MKDAVTDSELEIEINLEEIDWSAAPRDDAPRPARPTAVPPPPAEAKMPPTPSGLPPAFNEIVGRVGSARLRGLVGITFARLLRVLNTLGAIEGALTRPNVVKLGPLFEDVRAQTASLLSQITKAVAEGPELGEDVRRMLDGVRFVIGHEVAKVYRQEFPRLTEEWHPGYSRADLSRAWGLLHNCLQQTVITLAQAFAPGVTGQHLFEDYSSKVENSFTLYRELNWLLRKVRAAEKSDGILLKHSLVRHIEHFRDETMHLLMYKDWGVFGRYVDDVKRAFEEMDNFEPVLHEFSQYLSTLVYHVSMREVLRNAGAQAEEDAI